jgi:hypothetical protein
MSFNSPSHGMSSDEMRKYIFECTRTGLKELENAILDQAHAIIPDINVRKQQVIQELKIILTRVHENDEVDVSRARLQGMLRYLMENGEYKADTVQLDYLRKKELLLPGDQLIDLGAGSGEVVRAWNAEGNPAVGIDASPSFVAKHDILRLGLIDDDITHLRKAIDTVQRTKTGRRRVLTNLTLDRVADPLGLLRNVIELAEESDAEFAVGSLFPIRPVDDEAGAKEHPLTYTPHNKRLTSADTLEEQLKDVAVRLQDMSKRKVDIQQLSYRVHTQDGYQDYDHYYMLTSRGKKA